MSQHATRPPGTPPGISSLSASSPLSGGAGAGGTRLAPLTDVATRLSDFARLEGMHDKHMTRIRSVHEQVRTSLACAAPRRGCTRTGPHLHLRSLRPPAVAAPARCRALLRQPGFPRPRRPSLCCGVQPQLRDAHPRHPSPLATRPPGPGGSHRGGGHVGRHVRRLHGRAGAAPGGLAQEPGHVSEPARQQRARRGAVQGGRASRWRGCLLMRGGSGRGRAGAGVYAGGRGAASGRIASLLASVRVCVRASPPGAGAWRRPSRGTRNSAARWPPPTSR
jgi:hypothetical protein